MSNYFCTVCHRVWTDSDAVHLPFTSFVYLPNYLFNTVIHHRNCPNCGHSQGQLDLFYCQGWLTNLGKLSQVSKKS